MKALPSGVPGIDRIVGGGLIRGSCVLVEGVPGTGKTTLALQVAVAQAEAGRRCAVVFFEELPGNVVRDARSFGWDFEQLERSDRLILVCTSPMIFWEQLSGGRGPMGRKLAEGELDFVVVDSLSHFAEQSTSAEQARQAVYSLIGGLKRAGVTSLLTKELPSADPKIVPFEEYLTDSVWRLSYETEPDQRRRRYFEVLKSRGAPHLPGKHPLAITAQGIVVYPRACPTDAPTPIAHDRLVSTGSEGLDAMLGGGIPEGFSVLVAGGAGVGKTTLALSFCCKGAEMGEPALFLTFQEPPSKLLRLAEGLAFPLARYLEQGLVHIYHRPPVDLCLDAVLVQAVEAMDATGARRVAVDSLTDLASAGEGSRLREFTYCLSDEARRRAATTLLVSEVPELFGPTAVSSHHLSIIADGIILLKYLELESEIQRCVSVLKMRTMDHDKSIRRFVIGQGGLRVLSRFEGTQGVLAGAPSTIPITLAVRSFGEFDERLNEELLQRFAQLHPNVQPIPLLLPHNPDEALPTIQRALESPQGPLSAVPLCMYWMPQVIDPALLTPLDDLCPNKDAYLAETIHAATVDGHLYAVPAIAVCGVLLYRKDLLTKYGFAAPPATWDELIEQATTIVRGEDNPDLAGYAFPGYLYENLNATYLMNLWSNGGDVVDADGAVSLDSDQALEAARFMYDVVHVHRLTSPELTTPEYGLHPEKHFWEGKAVFATERPIATFGMFQQHSPLWESVAIAPHPRGPRGQQSVSFLGGWHYCIPRAARNPVTAAEFIRFMTSREVQKERALRGGPLPVLRDLYDDPEILAANPHYEVLREIVTTARSRHRIPRYLDFSRAMQRSLYA
ncbi:MAG: extracellular solute-binding protein, partial [Armatimonadetes bacterium]|nr:extracellular solute-binding protein [Armatimonadota bacterium]